MNCTEYAALLQSYADADLDRTHQRAMEAHGLRCFTCTEALEETRDLIRLLDRMERDPAPPGIVEAVLSQLPSGCVELGRSRVVGASAWRRRAAVALGLGGSVALLLLLGTLLVSPSQWTARLGTLATWWYAWVGDLAGTLTWLRTSSTAEIEPAATALLRAGGLLLRASAVPLLACWSLATLIGLGLMGHAPAARQGLRRS